MDPGEPAEKQENGVVTQPTLSNSRPLHKPRHVQAGSGYSWPSSRRLPCRRASRLVSD